MWSMEEVEVVLVGDKTNCLRLTLSTINSRIGWDVLIKSTLNSVIRRSDGGNSSSEASR